MYNDDAVCIPNTNVGIYSKTARVETVYYSKKYLEMLTSSGNWLASRMATGEFMKFFMHNTITGISFNVSYKNSFSLNDKHPKIIDINGTRSVHQNNDVCMKLLNKCSVLYNGQHTNDTPNTLAHNAVWVKTK